MSQLPKNEKPRWQYGARPPHPGEYVREDVLPNLGMTCARLARRLRVDTAAVEALVSESAPVTPDMAIRLGRLLGNGPDLWLNLQNFYDLWQAHQTNKPEYARISKIRQRKAS